MLLQCELPSFCSSHSGREFLPGVLPSSNQTPPLSLTPPWLCSPPSPFFSTPSSPLPFFLLHFHSLRHFGDPDQEEASHSPSRHHTRLHALQTRSLRKLHQAGPNGKLRSRSLARQPAPSTSETRRHNLNSASILSRHRCIALPSFADRQHAFKGAGNSWVACWPCHQRCQCGGPHH